MEAKEKKKMESRLVQHFKRAVLGLMTVCLLFIFSACSPNGNRDDDEATDFGTALVSISISPASPSLADPTTQQFTATGIYGNGTTANITESVNWVSEYPTIATISDVSNSTTNPKGQVKTVITGSTKITARSGDIKGSTTLTVTSAVLQTIEVTPGYSTFAFATTPSIQFKATGIYNDGTIIDLTEFATWSSSATGFATVNNVAGDKGLATTIATGTATLTATYQSISGSTDVTLGTATAVAGSLRFTPFRPTLARKTYQPFMATVQLNDGSTQDVTEYVVWDATPDTIATISNSDDTRGLALMRDTTSDAVISANLGGVTGSSSTATVSAAYLYELQINPGFPYVAPGIPYPLKAIGIFRVGSVYYHQDVTEWVSWSSSNTSLATISNAMNSKGLATLTQVPGTANRTTTINVKSPLLATLTGTTTLTVQSNSLVLNSIVISPSAPTNHIYSNQRFKAYGVFSDGTKSYRQDISHVVVWSSSDTSVAVISNEGKTYGKAVNRTSGATTIQAALEGVSGSSVLTVKPATYTVTTIAVTPDSPAVGVGIGTNLHLTATATFSNGIDSFTQDVTESVLWTSGSEANAMVSNVESARGIVTGIANAGTNSLITADWRSTNSDSETVAVEDIASISALAISAASSTGSDGSYQLTATATYVSPKTQDVTESAIWSSSRPEVATVSNVKGTKGRLTNNASGTTTITVRIDNESATLSRTVD